MQSEQQKEDQGDLLKLAERCEQASGADQSIARLIVATIYPGDRDMMRMVERGRLDPTRSTDEALSLVPSGPGNWPQVQYLSPNPNARDASAAHRVTMWLQTATVRGRSKSSAALAMTAAALRARHAATLAPHTEPRNG